MPNPFIIKKAVLEKSPPKTVLPTFDHPFCDEENSFYDLSKYVENPYPVGKEDKIESESG